MKHVKEFVISDEIANEDIENTVKNVKSSEEAMGLLNKLKSC